MLKSEGTNTYLIGTGPSRLLVDTGEGKPSWPQAISRVLNSEKANISQALITHWHHDHVGGCNQLVQLCPQASLYENNPPDTRQPISDGQIFKTEGATLRAFHCPGHTTNHIAFILEEEDAMFTGDNVLGHGTAVFEDLATYLTSLGRMKAQFKGRAYPGHGDLIQDGPAKVQEYIDHRMEREQQVLQTLRDESRAMTPMDIVKIIYKDYPEGLYEPAAKGVLQILRKLEGEGKVAREGKEKWKIVEKAAL